jgi:putative transposase
MPWKTSDTVDQRMRFIVAHADGLYSHSELCVRFEISRQTGYKWLDRYAREGVDGLKDRSHAPKVCPHQVPVEVQRLLLEAKAQHPTWGARKLLPWLARRHPELALPAASTAGDLLRRKGLTQTQKRRRKWRHPGEPAFHAEEPNALWCADFKGQFRLQNGEFCFPLTITDAYSRMLLCCQGLGSVRGAGVIPCFQKLFACYGLPRAIRTDNGVPFATTAVAGLSQLNVWWIKLGIAHQRIEPGCPEQNGRHERMHRTLKAEATRPSQASFAGQQKHFDAFQHEYNHERPHEALAQQTPASQYQASPRPLPAALPAPQYPSHYLLRKVSNAGTFRFKRSQPFLSNSLKHEWVAMEEIADGIWSVYFYDVLLCRWDERQLKLDNPAPRKRMKNA